MDKNKKDKYFLYNKMIEDKKRYEKMMINQILSYDKRRMENK